MKMAGPVPAVFDAEIVRRYTCRNHAVTETTPAAPSMLIPVCSPKQAT